MKQRALVSILSILFSLGLGRVALAYEYPVPIYVSTDDDINELYYSQDISEEEQTLLLKMLQDPIELNSASRDELYNLPGLTWTTVDAIIAYRAATPFSRITQLKKVPGVGDDVYMQLKVFAYASPPAAAPKPGKKPGAKKPGKRAAKKGENFQNIKGNVSYRITDSIDKNDIDGPEMYVRTVAKDSAGNMAGVAVIMDNNVPSVDYRDASNTGGVAVWKTKNNKLQCEDMAVDENGKSIPGTCAGGPGDIPVEDKAVERYLLTSGRGYRIPWPKFYAATKREEWGAIVGSYTVGFGQRLVIDNSGGQNPHGFQPDADVYEGYGSVSLSRGFTGLAGYYKFYNEPGLVLEVSPFFSYWKTDIYQYYLKHRNTDLPSSDPNYLESYVILKKTRKLNGIQYYRKESYVSLPQAVSEMVVGTNISAIVNNDIQVGVTGYWASASFNLGDPNTTFSRTANYPEDRTDYGAVGMDFSWNLIRPLTFYGEGAAADSGGIAGIIKGVWDDKQFAIEASSRYLADDFDNPHARAESMSDTWFGNSDRGEIGYRLDASYRPFSWLRLKIGEDLWRAIAWGDTKETFTKDIWKSDTMFRTDVYPLSWLTVGGFYQYRDNNLDKGGDKIGYDEGGGKHQVGVQSTVSPLRWMQFWMYYKIYFMDSKKYSDFDKAHYGTFKVRLSPWRYLDFSARFKYYQDLPAEDLIEETETTGSASSEEFMEVALTADSELVKGINVGVRGGMLDYTAGTKANDDNEYYWKAQARWDF